jgi:hypothetical protein
LRIVRKDPLAVLDTRALQRGDIVRDAFVIFGHEEKDVVENAGIMKPADPNRRRWYFVKDLVPQEALVFKIIDEKGVKKTAWALLTVALLIRRQKDLRRIGKVLKFGVFASEFYNFFILEGQATYTSLYWSISV